MIDLHCHLLPGIDDGPATLEEALAMARLAVANGIRESRVTPHLHVGQWDNGLWRIKAAVEFLEQGWVTVIASDAHDTEARPPRLKAGLEVATRVIGAKAAQRLVAGLPKK